jgi:hypothetical protein
VKNSEFPSEIKEVLKIHQLKLHFILRIHASDKSVPIPTTQATKLMMCVSSTKCWQNEEPLYVGCSVLKFNQRPQLKASAFSNLCITNKTGNVRITQH